MRSILAFLLVSTSIVAQSTDEYFASPLKIPLQLAGNFGELRSNHFHAGFDFRTQQREGLEVMAAADGFVSRIKISPYGYGKAIYIDHPNGNTTVYGHLSQGIGAVEDYIEKMQYAQQAYEIDVKPSPEDLPVKKSDVFALSGNTGGSEGPHLHFEIRESKSEKVMNPMNFGFSRFFRDTKKPQIAGIIVYPMDDGSIAKGAQRPVSVNISLQKDGTYLGEKVTASGRIGFGISVVDYDDVSFGRNGIYKIETNVNGQNPYTIKFDGFSFDETRYLNAFIDYSRYKKTRQRYQKLFMKNDYPLSIIHKNKDNGIINVGPNFNETYKIEVSDFFENKIVVIIPIEYSNASSVVAEEEKGKYFIRANKDASFKIDGKSVFFAAGTFYDDFNMDFSVTDSVMTVHNDDVAVHSNFVVAIEAPPSPDSDKTFIASIQGKKLLYNKTKYNGIIYSCWTKNLGGFKLAKDTTAPKIRIAKDIEGKWITSQKSVSLTISDDLSGLNTYNGFINGNWVLFEYDYKTRRITHVFEDRFINEGANDLKVVVNDNVGNSAIFETRFYKSKKQ